MEQNKDKIAIQNLFDGLKKCNPISEKLLMRLLNRMGINYN